MAVDSNTLPDVLALDAETCDRLAAAWPSTERYLPELLDLLFSAFSEGAQASSDSELLPDTNGEQALRRDCNDAWRGLLSGNSDMRYLTAARSVGARLSQAGLPLHGYFAGHALVRERLCQAASDDGTDARLALSDVMSRLSMLDLAVVASAYCAPPEQQSALVRIFEDREEITAKSDDTAARTDDRPAVQPATVAAVVDLGEMVEAVIAERQDAAFGRGLELAAFMAPTIPNGVICDVDEVRRVLGALIDNAIAFTRQGGVAVDIDASDIDADRFILTCQVADTGIGMPKEHSQDLVRYFGAAGGEAAPGPFAQTLVGRGLTYCRQAVARMGGAMALESEDGVGSLFQVELPLRSVDPVAGTDATTALAGKYLIIGRDGVTAYCLEKQLRAWGGEVDTVEVPAVALRMLTEARLQQRPYETVFVDDPIQGMSPASFVEMLPDFVDRDRTNFVWLASAAGYLPTGADGDGHFDDCLRKPIRRSDLERAFGPAKADDARAVGPRILLAEDNSVNRMVIAAMLGDFGGTIVAVENGLEAVQAVQRETFDLILMDIQMPVMDGLEAVQEIRGMPGAKGEVPIIAVTANAMKGDREKYLEMGMNDYVAKPVARDVLLTAISRFCTVATPFNGAGAKQAADARTAPEPAQIHEFSDVIVSLTQPANRLVDRD